MGGPALEFSLPYLRGAVKSDMVLLLTALFLDPQLQKFASEHPKSYLALKMEITCRLGCSKNYDRGIWLPKEKACLCGDLVEPRDLFLKDFTLKMKPSPDPEY